MKKIIIMLVAVVSVSSVSAQYYKSNILGIRGGLNAAMLTTDFDEELNTHRNALLGWTIGVSDQILLSPRTPFYFETGLYFSRKGGGYEYVHGGNNFTERFGVTYLQIPLKINYHVWVGAFTFEPYIGFHYNVGLWGRRKSKVETSNGSAKETQNLFHAEVFQRSDVGMMLGLGGSWSDLYFGLGWEAGFLNLSKIEGTKAYNSSVFQVLVGYNF